MRLDSKKVQFIFPMMPGVFIQKLRFAGRENTVQLQETALVIEANLLKVGLLGLERLFREALAEWSSVTIPYSQITRVKFIRFPLLRLLALGYLWLSPLVLALVLVAQDSVPAALIGVVLGALGLLAAFAITRVAPLYSLLIGLLLGPVGLLAAYTLFRVPPRYTIEFRSRQGRRTSLQLQISDKKLRLAFAAKLKEYRDATKQFRSARGRDPRGGPRLGALVALASFFVIIIACGVAYLGWAFFISDEGHLWPGLHPPPGGNRQGMPGPGGPLSRPQLTPEAPPLTAGGTQTPFTFEPLAQQPGTAPRVLSGPAILFSAVWLPGGRLATADMNGAVRVWDLAAGRGTTYTLGGGWKGTLLALTPDPVAPAGVRAALTSSVGVGGVYLWAVGDPGPMSPLPGAEMFALNAAFDPTGRVLTYASGTSLHAWDVKARARIGKQPISSILFNRASFSRDGKRLVTVEPMTHQLLVWSPGAGAASNWSGYEAAALSPDGSIVAVRTVGQTPVLRLMDTQSGQTVREIGAATGPAWLAYAPGGRVLAGGLLEANQMGVGFWDSGTGRRIGQLTRDSFFAQQGIFDPTASLFAEVGINDVRVWRIPPDVRAAIQGEIAPLNPREEIPPPRPVGSSIPPPRPVRR